MSIKLNTGTKLGATAEYSPHTNLNFFSFVVEVFMSWSVCMIFIEVLFMSRSSTSFTSCCCVVDVDVTTFLECCCRCQGQPQLFNSLLRCSCRGQYQLFSFVVEVFMSWSVCIIFIEVLFMSRSSTSFTSCCCVVDVDVTTFLECCCRCQGQPQLFNSLLRCSCRR